MTSNKFFKNKVNVFKTNSGLLKFARLYELSAFWQKVLISVILGIISSIAGALFVEPTGLYVGGFNACFQGISRLVRVVMTQTLKIQDEFFVNIIYSSLFWGMYIVLNIFLFFWGWKKISKTFAMLSLIYIVVTQGLAFIWTSFGCFKNIFIFGETATVNENLKDAKVLCLQFYNYWYPKPPIDGTSSYDWSQLIPANSIGAKQKYDIDTLNIIRIFCLLVYAVIYGIINGVICALLFITNSSTAGSDIVAVYWSQIKNKPVNNLLLLIHGSGLAFGIFFGNFVAGWIVDPTHYCRIEYFLTGNLLCSIVWTIVCTSVLKLLFPWRRLIRIEVYSNKIKEINKELFKNDYFNPTTIIDSHGGFSNVRGKILVTIGQMIIIPKVISIIRKIDRDCLISTQYINDIDGRITYQRQG